MKLRRKSVNTQKFPVEGSAIAVQHNNTLWLVGQDGPVKCGEAYKGRTISDGQR